MVSVSAPGFFPGDVVAVSLTRANSLVPVFIHGAPVRAYVAAPPIRVQIDGLFADWASRDVLDTDSKTVSNPDLDIVGYGAATSNSTAFFHVHVAGTMLGGGIPERLFKSPVSVGNGSSGAGSPIQSRRTGEDILLVYLDSNSSDPQGFSIGGISANYLVEICGEGGKIASKTVYFWSNRWIRQPGVSVVAAKDDTDIEASLPIVGLNRTRIVIQSTNWASAGDVTIPVAAPSFVSPSASVMNPLSIALPKPLDFAGSEFFLHVLGPPFTSATDCPVAQGMSTTRGSSSTTFITLNLGDTICFFSDVPLTDQPIPAGSWSASLDLSTSTLTTMDLAFAVTDQNGGSPSPICSATLTTSGGVDQPASCTGSAVTVTNTQRIRLLIKVTSGGPIDLIYDGVALSRDSSLTVPIPEFGDASISILAVISLIIFLGLRRKRTMP